MSDHPWYRDTRKATDARLRKQAHLSVDDPIALAKAARIVRAALARQRITLADLTPLPRHDTERTIPVTLPTSASELPEVDQP